MQLLRILALAALAVMAGEISTSAAIGFDEINHKTTSVQENRAAADAPYLLPVSGPAVAPNPPVPEYLAPGAPTAIGGAPDPSSAPTAASAKPAASTKPATSAKPAASAKATTPSVSPTAAKATPTSKTKKRSMDDEDDN